jgi:hypothetical protein
MVRNRVKVKVANYHVIMHELVTLQLALVRTDEQLELVSLEHLACDVRPKVAAASTVIVGTAAERRLGVTP